MDAEDGVTMLVSDDGVEGVGVCGGSGGNRAVVLVAVVVVVGVDGVGVGVGV